MAQCIFCRIVAGESPSRTVYESDRVQAFLDANPLAPGHTLVIPTDHYERLNDLPADLARDLLGTAQQLTPAIEAAVDAPASTVAINNGDAAGQEVPHVHVHVVPRFPDDDAGPIHALFDRRPSLSGDELDAIAADVAAHIGG
jgi:histidine triad (HIT) family protein